MDIRSKISKSLEDFAKENLNKNVRYHFSYDTIENDNTFKEYPEAKKFLLYVLSLARPLKINSYNESSLVMEFNNSLNSFKKRFPEYLIENLSSHFYFTLSLIESESSASIWSNQNDELDNNFQEYFDDLDFSSIEQEVVKF